MEKKKILWRILDYGVYAIVMYLIFTMANYCMYMEQTCIEALPFGGVIPKGAMTCACLPCNVTDEIIQNNITPLCWPDTMNYPYVYSAMNNPDFMPNEDFEWGLECIEGMQRWREIYG